MREMMSAGGSMVMSWVAAMTSPKSTPAPEPANPAKVTLEMTPDGETVYSTMLEEGQRIDIVDFEPVPGCNGGRNLRTLVSGARVTAVRVAAPASSSGAALPYYFLLECDAKQAQALGTPTLERPLYLMSAV